MFPCLPEQLKPVKYHVSMEWQQSLDFHNNSPKHVHTFHRFIHQQEMQTCQQIHGAWKLLQINNDFNLLKIVQHIYVAISQSNTLIIFSNSYKQCAQ